MPNPKPRCGLQALLLVVPFLCTDAVSSSESGYVPDGDDQVIEKLRKSRVDLRSKQSRAATDQVTLAGNTGFNRLSSIGSDTATAADGKVKSSVWPNEWRLGEDVTDIALTDVTSGPSFSNVPPVGYNIAQNDQDHLQVVPYAAMPNAAPTNRKDR